MFWIVLSQKTRFLNKPKFEAEFKNLGANLLKAHKSFS